MLLLVLLPRYVCVPAEQTVARTGGTEALAGGGTGSGGRSGGEQGSRPELWRCLRILHRPHEVLEGLTQSTDGCC